MHVYIYAVPVRELTLLPYSWLKFGKLALPHAAYACAWLFTHYVEIISNYTLNKINLNVMH